jgi:hypothetical protein
MAVYGVDYYGTVRYGSGSGGSGSSAFTVEDIRGASVAPLSAVLNDFGVVTLNWTSPDTLGAQGSIYQMVRIVRSLRGYPISFDDGDLAFQSAYPATSYTDSGLLPGRFYYYSAFIGLTPVKWDSTITYIQNELVTGSDGHPYLALANNTATDPTTNPGTWELLADGAVVWVKAEGITVLPTANHYYKNAVYQSIPAPYRALSDSVGTSPAEVDNPDLRKFTDVFAFALDQIRTDYDQIPLSRDVDKMRASLLDVLAADLGDGTYPSVPYRQRRARAKSFSMISRLKGSVEGIRSSVNSVTDWDIVIDPGTNMMLDLDVAEFRYPIVPVWSLAVSYPAGAVVKDGAYYYQCKTGGALGTGQAPSGAATTNTWWTYLTEANTEYPYVGDYSPNTIYGKSCVVSYSGHFYLSANTGLLGSAPTGAATSNANWTYLTDDLGVLNDGNVDTGGFSGWEAGIGTLDKVATDPYIFNYFMTKAHNQTGPDGSANASNLLKVTNLSGSTQSVGARSVPRMLSTAALSNVLTQGDVAKWGVPIPTPEDWASNKKYHAADVVQWGPSRYVCVADNVGVSPTGTTNGNLYWAYLSRVEDVAYTASYSTQKAGATGRVARAQIEWYSGDGVLIATAAEWLDNTDIGMQYADTFAGFGILDVRHLPFRAGTAVDATWTTVASSAWRVGYNVAYLDPSVAGQPTRDFAWFTGETNGTVAITFRDIPASATRGSGVLFRGSDDSNYWYATSRALVKVVAGTATTLATWTPLSPGDRMRVNFSDSAGGVEVLKYNSVDQWVANGRFTSLAISADTFNQTATRVGVYADFL